MSPKEIAEVLEQIAQLLELKGENPFKIRAYQAGARALETYDGDFNALVAEEKLGTISGIGSALTEKITTLHKTGRLEFFEKLKAEVPAGLVAMLEIPGLGPKKIKAMHEKLGVDTIEKLAAACAAGKVAELPGFGQKTQEKIAEGIRNREAYSRRHLWWDANEVAQRILKLLRGLPQVACVEAAGSLRRGRETVGDLDFIVGSNEPEPIMEAFTQMSGVEEVTAKGETKSSVRFANGLQADLRVVPPEQYAFALHHFTGSKEHNVKLRQRALARGWSLSEWGLTPKDSEPSSEDLEKVKAIRDEAGLFSFLGLAEIVPELREGLDELEVAEKGPLPELVKESDLRGVFHNHTTASDGKDSLEAMIKAAAGYGWEYVGIADHSKASYQANGLNEERVLQQAEKIKQINASGAYPIRVLAGVECDILADGRLDLSDECLRELDYVVVAVHNAFSQSEEEMTARIIRALEHPLSTMLAHPTGRLLLKREGYKVNMAKVIDAAIANGKAIEINGHPIRLEMDWRLWKAAAARGLKTAINPDAHETTGFAHVKSGVLTARKGWLRKEDIINCWPLDTVMKHFARKG